MTWKREQGKQSWSLHRIQLWHSESVMGPVVKGFIVVLFLEGWCKVEGRLSQSYMWVRAWPECHLEASVCVSSAELPLWIRMYTLLLVRMFVWRLRVWAWKPAMPLWRLSLASLAEADTHRGKGNRRKPMVTLCFLVPLSVIFIWGGLYNDQMWALTHRLFRCPHWGTFQLSHFPSSSPLPISTLFSLSRLMPQFLDSIPCHSFLYTCALSCFGSPSSFVVVSGRNEDGWCRHSGGWHHSNNP